MAGSHVSVVQASPSSQVMVVWMQASFVSSHVSVVQASPSSQIPPGIGRASHAVWQKNARPLDRQARPGREWIPVQFGQIDVIGSATYAGCSFTNTVPNPSSKSVVGTDGKVST